MRILRFISVLLHPIVIPTLVTLCYFLMVPIYFASEQKLAIITLIFLTTYLIPVLFVFLFKRLGVLTNYDRISLSERKLPVLVMLVLFFMIGRTLFVIPNFRDLGTLYYSSSAALAFIYFLSFFRIKASLHLVAMGIAVGFFLYLNSYYSRSLLILIVLSILLSGFVSSALLYLKTYKEEEIYVGFFIGILAPLLFSNFL